MIQLVLKKLVSNSKYKILSMIMGVKIIITDQLIKSYLMHLLTQTDTEEIVICKYLHITYSWNYGISFGMFDYQTNNMVFLILNTMIILYLVYLTIISAGLLFYGYLFIATGGISNIIDRILYGAVFDFIDIDIIVFNLADMYILLGFIMLVIHYLNNRFCNTNIDSKNSNPR